MLTVVLFVLGHSKTLVAFIIGGLSGIRQVAGNMGVNR